MESRLPVSKPLLLVLIGLIIGASLGLGSGYAVFYPNMVNENSRTIEGRVIDVEDNIGELGVMLDSMNQNITSLGDSLEDILALADIINGISDRVTALETGQVALSGELDDVEGSLSGELDALEGTLNQLNEDVVDLNDEWEEVIIDLADLETTYESANNALESIQALVRENDGITIYTSYMANPSDGFIQDISDALYGQLIVENEDFGDWVAIFGETTAKILLNQEVDDMMGSLVWNPTENTEVGSDSYQVKLETYFRFELSAASITVNKMHVEIKATVNLDTGAISAKQISFVEIM
ncbi:MAG: hypothetical protein ACERKS_02890 [Candidatus Bathyarchaeota archaeon]